MAAGQVRGGPARPVYLRWQSVALVAAGGTVGTAAREALVLAVPATGPFPVLIFCLNVVGSLLLGVLLEALVRRGPDEGGRRAMRLLLGTGLLGGFTTYSALATDVILLTGNGRPGLAGLYALSTLVVGIAASWAGVVLGARLSTRERGR